MQIHVRGRLGDNLAVGVSQALIEHEHANVFNQGSQKRFFLLHGADFCRNSAGGGGGIEAAPPIRHMLEALGLVRLQFETQRKAEHQRLDRLQSQNHQRVTDRADVLAAAVEAAELTVRRIFVD